MKHRLFCLAAALLLAHTAHAAPRHDPIGKIIKNKQQQNSKPKSKPAENSKTKTRDNGKTKTRPSQAEKTKPQSKTAEKTKSQPKTPERGKPAPQSRSAAKPQPQRKEQDTDEIGTIIRQSQERDRLAKVRPPAPPPSPPPGESPPSREYEGRGDADELISSAMGFIGVAYRFGGTSPTGFDCSGFMQYIFRKAFAVNLPRTSAEQANVGIPVSRSELRPGDMVFFRTHGRRISHVGMYIGNDRFIHAPRTGKRIEITSLSGKYWNARYATARRVKRNNAQDFIRN